MGLWTDVVGTVRGYIRLGLTGVRLKNSSGALAVRNAGDSAYAKVECDSIELGHASDTTLARVSAGVIAVEGNNVITAADAASQAEMEAGTEAALRSMSPLRIAQAIAALATGGFAIGTHVTMSTGSPTAIEYTGIPSGTTVIVISFAGASTNGTSGQIVQLGDADGYETSGYTGTVEIGASRAAFNSGFLLSVTTAATMLHGGHMVLVRMDAGGTKWSMSSIVSLDDGAAGVYTGGGYKMLTGELDRIRWTTVGGTDVADAGTMNIAYL